MSYPTTILSCDVEIEPNSQTKSLVIRGVKSIVPGVPIQGYKDAARYFMDQVFAPFHECPQEEFVVLLLDSKHRVRFEVALYRGTISAAVIRVAEVFREAIRLNAYAILVAHNHPSGNATPSTEDEEITRILKAAGDLLDINVLDHIVVGDNQWTSLRQKGILGAVSYVTAKYV